MNLNDLGERQSKLILERIHQADKNITNLNEALEAYTRKESRARDKVDEMAKVFKSISENEHYNATTKKALDSISNGMSFLADHQSLEIQRIEEKVIQDLSQYQLICQNAKEEIKNQIMLRDREVSKRKQLDLNRRTKSENEVILSNMQISKILKEIATISEQFEKQKLADFKEGLTNLVLIELKYHARCLEVLTMIHEDVSTIDEKQDIEQFKKHFQHNERTSSGFFLSRIKSQSLGALSSMMEKKPVREKKLRSKTISKSSISLNSLDSNGDEEVRTESRPQIINMSNDSLETKTSDSDDTESETEDESASKDEEVVKPLKSQIQQVKRFQ